MDELIRKDSALEICDRWRRRAKDVHDRDGFYIANVIYEQMKELEDAQSRAINGVLFKGRLEEGKYNLIKTTDGWVLDGENIAYAGFDICR